MLGNFAVKRSLCPSTRFKGLHTKFYWIQSSGLALKAKQADRDYQTYKITSSGIDTKAELQNIKLALF